MNNIGDWETTFEDVVLRARESGCTCQYYLVNVSSGDHILPDIRRVSRQNGCSIEGHCEHRGINYGGRCHCGVRV